MTRPGQLALDFGHRPALGREDFLVAPCNEDAVAWIDRWPDWPGPALVIHGPAGCGKTHLARVWRRRSGVPEASVVEDADRAADDVALFNLYNRHAGDGLHLLVTARTPPARWSGRSSWRRSWSPRVSPARPPGTRFPRIPSATSGALP